MAETEGGDVGALFANGTCLEMAAAKAAGGDLEMQAMVMLVQGILLALAFVAVKFVHKYHVPLMTECGSVIVMGFIFGGVMAHLRPEVGRAAAVFNANAFFLIILPPIIFDAGFSLTSQGASLSANSGTILMLAIIGTIVSTIVVGTLLFVGFGTIAGGDISLWESLAFGSLISAVDPVATLAVLSEVFPGTKPDMFYLVFGESVINDAVSIVLYTVCEGVLKSQEAAASGQGSAAGEGGDEGFLSVFVRFWMVFFGSVAIGVVMSAAIAFFLKWVNLRQHGSIEIVSIFLGAFAVYSASQGIGMSGIMSIFVAGRLFRQWVLPNLSVANRLFIPRLSKAIAETAELYVFAFLGSAAWGYAECLTWNVAFIAATFIFILLGRAANVFPLCALSNMLRDESGNEIGFNEQVFMWFSGLRGAIAFALACYGTNSGTLKKGDLLVTTTLVTVMLTVFIFGGLAKPMLSFLRLAPKSGGDGRGGGVDATRGSDNSSVEPGENLEGRLLDDTDDANGVADVICPLDSDMNDNIGAAYDPPPHWDTTDPKNNTFLKRHWRRLRCAMWRVGTTVVSWETRYLKPLICVPASGQDRKREKLCSKLLKEGVEHGPFLDTLTDRTLRHIVVSTARPVLSPVGVTGYGPTLHAQDEQDVGDEEAPAAAQTTTELTELPEDTEMVPREKSGTIVSAAGGDRAATRRTSSPRGSGGGGGDAAVHDRGASTAPRKTRSKSAPVVRPITDRTAPNPVPAAKKGPLAKDC